MDNEKRNLQEKGIKAPIAVAVCGHMDIPVQDQGRVKEHMKDFLKDLDSRYPNTDIVLLTPLGPGADQLAAEAAIELGIGYKAVIPCKPDKYKTNTFDQADPVYLARFHEYFGKASERIVLPDMRSPDDVFADEETWFKNQLVCMAAYLISTSHIIMAAWDGICNGYRGGTSDLIECAHSGVDPPVLDRINRLYMKGEDLSLGDGRNGSGIAYLNIREDSLLYHIPTPRNKDSEERNSILRECRPCYYLPKTIFESRGHEDKFSYVIPNDYGWKGMTGFPSHYGMIFGKIDELNGNIESILQDRTVDLHRNAMNDLFDLGSYEKYLDTIESMENECTRIRRENEGKPHDEVADLEDEALVKYIDGLRKERRSKNSVLLDFRLTLVNRTRSWLSRHGMETKGGIQKKLKAKRRERNELDLQIRTAEEYRSNRSGTSPEKTISNMKSALENARKSSDDLEKKYSDAKNGADLDPLRYAAVDALAIRQRDDNARHMSFNIVFTALTSLFLALYLIPNDSKFFTSLYVLFLVLNAGLVYRHNRKKTQSNYMDYRLLAETLRVKVYWDVLGISYPANDLCFSYLRNNTAWVRAAMTSWYTVATETPDNEELEKRQDLLECAWILNQYKYHQLKTIENSRKSGSVKYFALFFFVFNLFLSLFFVALSSFPIIDKSQVVISVEAGTLAAQILGEGTVFTVGNLIKVGNAVASLMFTATTAYVSKMIYGGSTDSMITKSKMFEVAQGRRRDSKLVIEDKKKNSYDEKAYRQDLKTATELYKELGIQAIEETNSWVTLHRTKNVQSFIDKYKKM